jgi:hypothetical protein
MATTMGARDVEAAALGTIGARGSIKATLAV